MVVDATLWLSFFSLPPSCSRSPPALIISPHFSTSLSFRQSMYNVIDFCFWPDDNFDGSLQVLIMKSRPGGWSLTKSYPGLPLHLQRVSKPPPFMATHEPPSFILFPG
ncbi:hypothetical protein M441DRAFT_62389 [Trichoderma asperellum CBS 433.97]|uniref:Uncharacterized protein n=1 Tax=Trichoderma asperellum (strain ATCC 204424 / CBS 433.97 / NBRC 101777) TaxID=1042311 RepID=A0A2T3YU00_TRIA4|nr:hypothetical protein M441DRAFT_62389 [Trichoderma asperellum CBS 433.97]PTB36017.1 hypothetical protein M441DRAFT_62389 [Trichoderma asperellum CBS 433.97]